MIWFLGTLHIIFCLLLIALVLLQDPKGGAAGGIFGGGGSNSLLGATGATTFLTKLTRVSAIGFGLICLLMTWYLKRDTGSVIDAVETPAAAATAPAAPGNTDKPADSGTAAGAAAGATQNTQPAAPAMTAPASGNETAPSNQATGGSEGSSKAAPKTEKK